MSWQRLVDGNPELTSYGASRFDKRVAYLATAQKDGEKPDGIMHFNY